MLWDVTVSSPGFTAESFWVPRHFVVSAWIEHAPFASWLIGATRPRTLVELGTHNGFSFFVFAEAARRLGLSTRLTAIDSWEGDDQAGFYGDEIYDEVKRIAGEDYPNSTELIRSYFDAAADRFADGSVDVLHIDGRHGYADVKEDFERYQPKVSSRGVVVFHDTHEFQDGFGVHRFWDEIAATRPSFTFHHGHGLGVLAWGDETPDAVLAFLDAANAEPDIMRARYAELGRRVSSYYDGIQVTDEMERLRIANLHLEGDLGHANRLLGESRREMEQLLSSRTWKATAPFRRAVSALRR